MALLQLLSLAEAKSHLRVAHSAEDALIQDLIYAARDHIINVLNTDDLPSNGDSPATVAYPVKAAGRLIVGDLYANREGKITGQFVVVENRAVLDLLYPYRQSIGI